MAVMDRFLDAWEDEEKGRGFDLYYQALESDDKGRCPGDDGFDGEKGTFTQILTKPTLYNVRMKGFGTVSGSEID